MADFRFGTQLGIDRLLFDWPSEPGEGGGQYLVDRTLERHRERRQVRQPHPAPGVERRVGIEVQADIAALAGEAQGEPALPLAAVPAAPGDAQKIGRKV